MRYDKYYILLLEIFIIYGFHVHHIRKNLDIQDADGIINTGVIYIDAIFHTYI